MIFCHTSVWTSNRYTLILYYMNQSEKAMATHSSTLAWKIPWTEEPGRLQSMGSEESDTTEQLHFHSPLPCIGEGNGNPLQCSCLENPRDGRAWWAAVYGVAQSQIWLKQLSSSSIWINIYFFLSCQKVAVRKDWSFITTRNFINFTSVEIEYECFLCAYDLIYPKYELKSFKMHIYILMICISMK